MRTPLTSLGPLCPSEKISEVEAQGERRQLGPPYSALGSPGFGAILRRMALVRQQLQAHPEAELCWASSVASSSLDSRGKSQVRTLLHEITVGPRHIMGLSNYIMCFVGGQGQRDS